jgi:hypothetical protein
MTNNLHSIRIPACRNAGSQRQAELALLHQKLIGIKKEAIYASIYLSFVSVILA